MAWNLTRVAPELGNSGEVQLLAALLHERGMKLLLDLPLAPLLHGTPLTVPGESVLCIQLRTSVKLFGKI